MSRDDLAAACLVVAATLALVFPPVVHPESGPAVAILLAAGLALAGRGVTAAGLLVALGAAAYSLAVTVSPGRTADTLLRFALVAGAFPLAAATAGRARRRLPPALLAGGAGLGLVALLQKGGLLARQAAAARAAGLPEAMVHRLAEGRPFGTHVVPAALAGALVLALAAGAAFLAGRRDGPGWVRPVAAAGLALAATGLLLTGSMGGFLSLVAGGGYLLAPRYRGMSGRWKVTLLLAVLLAGAAFLAVRPWNLLDLSRPDHPLHLRAGNWRGAVLAATERPVAGIGPGAFGAVYPRYRRPGDAETVYAHDSWLQLLAEGGIPALALLLLGAAALARKLPGLVGGDRWIAAGVVAFVVHNLVDFTLYLPGVAVPTAALAGLLWPSSVRGEARLPRLLAAIALLPVAAGWLGVAVAQRGLEAAGGNPRAAFAAASAAPWDVSRTLRAARLQLPAVRGGDPGGRARAEALASRLLALDPESPAPWHYLGDLRAAEGRPADAWRAWELAALRHPADPGVRSAVKAAEAAFRSAGLFDGKEGLPGWERRLPSRRPSPGRGDLLLLLLAGLAAWTLLRRLRPPRQGAPPEAVALAFLLILSCWGEGGALPGVRMGRVLVLAVAGLAALASRRGEREWPLLPAGLGALVLAAATLPAAVAPVRAPARDGWLSLAAAVLAGLLSWRLATRHREWPRTAATFLGAAAVPPALLWIVQRVVTRPGSRPAADFLHPGHLGTFLVAAGLALVALAGGTGRHRWFPAAGGGTLAVLGLLGGARATLLGFAAGLAVLAFAGGSPRVRRGAGVLLLAGGAAGTVGMWLRFRAGDPFAWARLQIWRGSLAALADRPLAGWGPGAFGPAAARFAFPGPGEFARWERVFRGPHSDLLGAFLFLGIPGGLVLLAALAVAVARGLGALRRAGTELRPGLLACAVPLAVFGAHGLVDDLVSARPAVALAVVVLLGALAGAARPGGPRVRPGPVATTLLAAGITTALLAGELVPWAAWRLDRLGRPLLAARLDPLRTSFQLAAARLPSGPPDRRLALGLARLERAARAASADPRPWRERARLLDAACRGLLAERSTCEAALAGWGAALARAPRDVFTRRARARLALHLADAARGEDDLRLALHLEPCFVPAARDLGRLLRQEGREAEAHRLEAGLAGRLEPLRDRVRRGEVSPYGLALLGLRQR